MHGLTLPNSCGLLQRPPCVVRIQGLRWPRVMSRRYRQNPIVARAQTAGLWDQLLGVFAGSDAVQRKMLRATSAELLQLLCDDAPDLTRVNELLDYLVAAAPQSFSENVLGGGPWVVRFTRGKPLLWNLTYNTGRLVNSKNRASQDFDPVSRSATNKVEINGPQSFIAAYGTYEPVDDSPVTPKTIRVRISSGRLVLGPLELPLPIAGSGLFEVLYADEGLRVFRSGGDRLAVQVRADRLGAAAGRR